ncbi:hypothetical protein JG559_13880 [Enterococcus faecalis]|uniref:Uncharacterized protein n=1 Tax=Enterococcus faecalis TaxID=1351 RepID=A0A974S6H8_ENTFL|nr:hypothetical protein JG559_13880 [Enterococcus faecalis]
MAFTKKFQHAYTEYVAGCNEMILATDPETGIDAELFNASEEKARPSNG